ncbi:hypothetical protein ACFLYO_07290 [Chloroflexota bacterium]
MSHETGSQLAQTIIQQAHNLGATTAGIADISDLQAAPAYQGNEPSWDAMAQAVLVFGVAHPHTIPDRDYWDDKPGGTPGNRHLMEIQKQLKQWLHTALNINSVALPYQVTDGGIFLKDAAVLAGLGVIGKNNLLLTPDYGPQIRWRAMFLDADLLASAPADFDPCTGCDRPCMAACPQDAFQSGTYDRECCQLQMSKDEANPSFYLVPKGGRHIRYCRACELACPVAPEG